MQSTLVEAGCISRRLHRMSKLSFATQFIAALAFFGFVFTDSARPTMAFAWKMIACGLSIILSPQLWRVERHLRRDLPPLMDADLSAESARRLFQALVVDEIAAPMRTEIRQHLTRRLTQSPRDLVTFPEEDLLLVMTSLRHASKSAQADRAFVLAGMDSVREWLREHSSECDCAEVRRQYEALQRECVKID